ncbi:hypothetical protein O3P69_003164 [Scylla paramamosain]|uniref:Peptidase S1 domain-containing protein n=1 Tax=Scylla paramamosain TaxID=85552 RepID=A0AAW0UJK4_SCYPA
MVAVIEILLVTLVLGAALSHATHRTAHATLQLRHQTNLCIALGGECLRRQRSCSGRTLPSLLCGSRGGTCCISGFETFMKTFRKPLKRLPVRDVCHKTTKKCNRRGGRCISSSSPCNTYAARKFCSGYSCTCCFGDHKACTSTPACKGGFCFRGTNKKVCHGGRIIRSGCTGSRCSCCIPKGSQSGNADHCICGKINENRIYGGSDVAPPHKYPWLVGLRVPPYKQNHCGGSIISSTYVLTAGHCLYEGNSGELYDPVKVKVRVGDHNQFSHLDDVKGVTQEVDVEEIIPHEYFIPYRPYHDIGLLRLKIQLDLASHPEVGAVCLPPSAALTYEGAKGVASGWGVIKEDTNVASAVAQEVTIPILGPTCKNTQYGDVTLTSNMLCAGVEEGGKDTCVGDSGGPLTVKEYNRHIIVGITSFGKGCGKPHSPGVYTRITGYLSWIRSKVQDTCLNA